jgi:hypothetical protein
MQELFSKKTDIYKKFFDSPQLVIIKGFKCEPVQLKAEGIENFLVRIVGNDGKTTTRLKAKYVYCYDEGAYLKLKNAFETNDKEQLMREWQCAKPITIS